MGGALMQFPIVLHNDDGTSYGVTVPDLPGCFSAGDTPEEAIASAHEAIACHVEGLLVDGESIPEKTRLEVHQANADYAGGIWALVDVDIAKLSSKTIRVNVTMPARVLSIVDEAAAREGESRSGLLTRAALHFVDRRIDA
jgi:predicted RNase H-like HicB family nuclease